MTNDLTVEVTRYQEDVEVLRVQLDAAQKQAQNARKRTAAAEAAAAAVAVSPHPMNMNTSAEAGGTSNCDMVARNSIQVEDVDLLLKDVQHLAKTGETPASTLQPAGSSEVPGLSQAALAAAGPSVTLQPNMQRGDPDPELAEHEAAVARSLSFLTPTRVAGGKDVDMADASPMLVPQRSPSLRDARQYGADSDSEREAGSAGVDDVSLLLAATDGLTSF